MHIALLAPRNSIHTVRWANALAEQGLDVSLISHIQGGPDLHSAVRVHTLPFSGKLGYFLNLPSLRRLLKRIQPDLLHSHYATGYGTLGALSRFQPFLISVWGSDVFEFPQKSPLHARLLRWALRCAARVCSTSHVMAEETRKYYAGPITVIPFGVDLKLFQEVPKTSGSDLTIGTIKTLGPKYGIDVLIRAFAIVLQKAPEIPVRLVIGGDGPDRDSLMDLATQLGIMARTEFLGQVPHAQVPETFRRMKVACFLSRSESFGVAAIEAGAAGAPVIASDVGGLKEVLKNDESGLIVPGEDPEAAADAILRLLRNPELARKLAKANRASIEANYDWSKNVAEMARTYELLFRGPSQT